MKTKFEPTSALRTSNASSLKFGAARLRSRIARQLPRGISRDSTPRFDSSLSLFNSLWSPLRLDLLKIPVSRHRE